MLSALQNYPVSQITKIFFRRILALDLSQSISADLINTAFSELGNISTPWAIKKRATFIFQ